MEDFSYEQPLTAKAMSESQIPRELQAQSMALDQLHSTIVELESRTGSIRIPRPDPSGLQPDSPAPVRSQVANEIADRTAAIEVATRRLSTIIHELEV